MGWSLGGILAGAGKGMADWAGREIVAEKQAERDAEQFARQKELATFQDELAAGRAERTAELTKRYADKTAAEKKETQSSAFEALEWAATKDPEGPKLKPGTAEYYRFLGDKLDASGEPDMAKQMYSNADKFEDNALRSRQIDAQLSGVAESRNARIDAKKEAGDLRREQFEFTKDKDYRAELNLLGTLKGKNKETGEDVLNYDGLPIVKQADQYLEAQLGIKDRSDRYNAIAKIRSDADAWRAKHPSVGFVDAMRMSADQFMIDHKNKK